MIFENQTLSMGMDGRERDIMRDLVSAFDAIANKTGTDYFVYGGTLLGYAR